MRFLWELSPFADCYEMNCAAKIPCFAASSLSPSRVARVSRLIGKIDSTVKFRVWQVRCATRNPLYPAPMHSVPIREREIRSEPRGQGAHARKATLFGVAFPLSCAGHWPPKRRVDGGFSTVPTADSPGRLSLLRAASLAVALAGHLLFFGLSGSFQQPVHHWRLSNSNRMAVCRFAPFKQLTHLAVREMS